MNKFLLILSGFFLFFTPVVPLLLLIGGVIALDTLTGVMAAYKRDENITSRKLSRVIGKMVIYTFSILLIYGLDILVLTTWIETYMLITKIAAGLILFIEGFSIDENIQKLNKGKGVKYYTEKLLSLIKVAKNKYQETFNDRKD